MSTNADQMTRHDKIQGTHTIKDSKRLLKQHKGELFKKELNYK